MLALADMAAEKNPRGALEDLDENEWQATVLDPQLRAVPSRGDLTH